jgi:hypothetical protein
MGYLKALLSALVDFLKSIKKFIFVSITIKHNRILFG